MVSISLTLGKFLITTGWSNNKVAANIGSDEFLEGSTETLPLILQGPSIKNLSINYLNFAKVIPVWP